MTWYATGSATFTPGSRTVTGVLCDWQANVAVGDAIRGPDRVAREVESVEAPGSLTLVLPYDGPSAVSVPYDIVPTQDRTRAQAAAVAQLVADYRMGAGGSGGVSAQPTYPYALTFEVPPPTSGLGVTFPAIRVQFTGKVVAMRETVITIEPQRIVDVWITDTGTYRTESVGLHEWPSLPRHDAWLHLARLQSSATKVSGVYMRRALLPVVKLPAALPLTDYHFNRRFTVPTTWQAWTDNSPATLNAVYLSPQGDLWMCTAPGTTSAAPVSPSYNEETNSGFATVISGTASFIFRGRSVYAGAWRVSPRAGVTWYFGLIGIGIMAARLPAQAKDGLKSAAFHIVNDWISGVPYALGRKVGGATTQGRVWECVAAGTTTATAPFPAGAAVGDTCTEGAVTWRCAGVFAHPAQRYFWYDTDPTMRALKSPDSHDSYAACWVWAAWRYLVATGDSAWLNEASPHNGLSYQQLMREVIYYNLTTQIGGATNLTTTFQGNGIPFGGEYGASFHMDNCEVWAGLKAAERIFTTYWPDAGYAASMAAFAEQVRGGIEGLWQEDVGAYRYYYGMPTMLPPTPGAAPFYPLCMSQAWGPLWGVPLDRERADRAFEYMHAHYPYWWKRNDADDNLAIGAHFGYALSSGLRTVREDIVRHCELERMAAGQPDFYVHDAAYYLALRDSPTLAALA